MSAVSSGTAFEPGDDAGLVAKVRSKAGPIVALSFLVDVGLIVAVEFAGLSVFWLLPGGAATPALAILYAAFM